MTLSEHCAERRRPDVLLAGLLAVGLGAGFYAYWCLELFPLVEFRDWLIGRFQPHLDHRAVSCSYATWIAAIAGDDVAVLNALALLPTVVSAWISFVLARRLGLAPWQAMLVTTMWWFSVGVASALGWQATLHDRFAWMFSAATLLVLLRQFESARSPARILASNVMLCLLLMLAFRSKESAWFLVPALVAMATLLPEAAGERRRRLACIALPIVCGTLDAVVYLFVSLPADPRWQQHVIADASNRGIGELLADMVAASGGLDVVGAMLLAIPSLAAIVILLRGRAAWRTPHAHRWLVALVTFAAALAVVLPTRYRAPFYLYVPTWWFAWLLVQSLEVLLAAGLSCSPRVLWLRGGLVVLLAAIWGGRFWQRFDAIEARVLRANAAFRASFETIRSVLSEPPRVELCFVAPQSAWFSYMFWSGGQDAWLRCVYGDAAVSKVDFEPGAKSMVRTAEAWADEPRGLPREAVVFVYDGMLQLLRIERGDGRLLFARDGG